MACNLKKIGKELLLQEQEKQKQNKKVGNEIIQEMINPASGRERWIFSDIKKDHFHRRCEKSEDDGNTWKISPGRYLLHAEHSADYGQQPEMRLGQFVALHIHLQREQAHDRRQCLCRRWRRA
jgi:hypothetical protein